MALESPAACGRVSEYYILELGYLMKIRFTLIVLFCMAWTCFATVISSEQPSSDGVQYETHIQMPGLNGMLMLIGADEVSSEIGELLSNMPDDTQPEVIEMGDLSTFDANRLPGAVLNGACRSASGIEAFFTHHADLQDRFSIALDETAALLVRGRRARIVGDGFAYFGLAPSANRDARIMKQKAGTTVDLIALSRAAVARASEEFPAKNMRDPVVANGTLFIGGGGRMPEAGMQRFIKASGGPDARIVVIPTALGRPDSFGFGEQSAQRIRNIGAKNVVVIHTMNPREADTDEFCAPLKGAGGIWFTGGRQWNLVDAYRGTKAHELMHDVLKRGGAIGGSSAGASIQAEYMVRGHPLGNTIMMAEGYEKGLNFLPGVGIDQHFAQRDRFADLASVKHAFPQLLCLGIDEQTMLIVKCSTIEVVGPNNLQVYDKPLPADFNGTEFVQVKPGERYDMKLKRKIEVEP